MDERYDQGDCTLLSLIIILTNVALACMSLIIVFSLRMTNCLTNLYTDYIGRAKRAHPLIRSMGIEIIIDTELCIWRAGPQKAV